MLYQAVKDFWGAGRLYDQHEIISLVPETACAWLTEGVIQEVKELEPAEQTVEIVPQADNATQPVQGSKKNKGKKPKEA